MVPSLFEYMLGTMRNKFYLILLFFHVNVLNFACWSVLVTMTCDAFNVCA